MSEDLGPCVICRKTGDERLHADGIDVGTDLLEFWRWSASDLVSNATRGRLAEFIVARAIGIPTSGVRNEWAAYDLETPTGVKIEVKSAAYVQSWRQKQLSKICFQTPKTRKWDADTGMDRSQARRHADVYIFALLIHTEKDTIDPLNVNQWRFYCVPTAELDARTRSQHSITLATLRKQHGDGLKFAELKSALGSCPIRRQ